MMIGTIQSLNAIFHQKTLNLLLVRESIWTQQYEMLCVSTVELYPAKSCNTFCAMRVCGICHFGSNMATDPVLLPAPAVALVIAFSITQLHGSHGIIGQIENLSEQKPLSMAAAYCCVCHHCTWLCRTDTDINEVSLEFLHMCCTGEQIGAALALMHRWRNRYSSFGSTRCWDPAMIARQSIKSMWLT
jgi:hypothetical protein